MRRLDEHANEHQLKLHIDEMFEVQLEENRTTGFQWQVAANGEPVCLLINDVFNTAQSTLQGQANVHCWQFQAHEPGRASIILVYQRPWEQDTSPRRTFTLHVSVAK